MVNLSVVDRDTGNTLPTYSQYGKRYVPGEPGHRYALRLSNHTSQRVMVVLSVDGVNAVTGQTAGAGQAGYVLDPWQTTEIAGWRKSYSDIAQFVFTAIDDSYASRTGRPDNVGVIGMAVFRERVPEPVYQPPMYQPSVAERKDEGSSYDRRYAARDAAPPAGASPPASMAAQAAGGSPYAQAKATGSMNREEAADSVAQEIGTGHGDREYSPTSQTDFVRLSSSPQQVTQLFYDTPQQLVVRGIMPRYYAQRRPRDNGPDAFPVGFVPDPSPSW
ncbi:MAG TPA: hypothetical protein VGT79_03330, partial [Xanthomonadaceae bacterium]|nr:hypothetical protein [Xanthomonadaceae bacterium]